VKGRGGGSQTGGTALVTGPADNTKTNLDTTCRNGRNGDVAQLVERLLCKQDVSGSSPLISKIQKAREYGLFSLSLYYRPSSL
jgi:hypothetical protein